MKQLNDRQIIIGPVRLSYLSVFTTKHNENRGENEYSAVLLIPKEPSEFLKEPKEELKGFADAVKRALATKFTGQLPAVWKNPLQDGDKELRSSDGEPKNPGYWFINVRTGEDRKPKLINGAKQAVTGGWNSGDWGLVKLSLFGYDQKGNKGVGCGLEAIQFLHKDEALGGSEPTDEGFDAVAIATASSDYDPFSE